MMREMVGGCCVCSDERGWADNPLVYCDGHGCNVAVHQACYGIIAVPTGPWFCRKCESQERAARVRCELCPQKEGALKKTDTQGWCHVLCALYIPEAWFGNVQTMEPIVLKGVPAERFNKLCYICEENGRVGKATTGACMQCNKSGCKQYFHVTCAQSQGLLCEESGSYMDNVRYCGYCKYHYKKLKKDSHLKVIPAFKPVAMEAGSTPESSPEKAPSLQSRSEHQKVREKPSKGAVGNSSPSAGATTSLSSPSDSVDVTTPNGGSASTGKFTTANFVETTITPSPASFKQGRDKSDKQDNSGSDTDCSRSESLDSSGSSSDSDSDSDEESSHQTKTKTKVDTKEASAIKSASTDSQTSTDSKKVVKNGTISVSTSSGTAVTTAGGGIITPPAPPSYSYCFENFLQRNYSGTQPPQSTTPKSTTLPVTSETDSKQRNFSKTAEKGEKKKAKKSKSLPDQAIVNGKGKGVKTPTTQSPPPGGATGPAKKATTAPAKRKRTASRSESGKSAAKASKLTPPAPRQTAAKKTATIKDSKLGNLSSNPFANVSAASNPTAVGVKPPATVALSGSVVTRAGLMGSTTNSSGVLNKTSTAAPATSPSGDMNMMQQFPSKMEQLLEQHWEQGNQFLLEQGQHFDLASLLDCLQQLRQENIRLEENINTLSSRRDQLLAVNARLAHPPTATNPSMGMTSTPLSSLARGLGVHNRSPRVNSILGHDDTNNVQDANQPWSPMLGQNPVQNSPGSQASRSNSLHHTPEKHPPVSKPAGHTPPGLAPPGGSPARVPVTDHKWLVQNLPGMRGQPLSRDHQMYQMLQQQHSLPYNPNATTAGIAMTTGMSSVAKTAAYAMLSQSMVTAAAKNDTQLSKEKT